MIEPDVRDRIIELVRAVRASSHALPVDQVVELHRAGVDVHVDRHDEETVVITSRRADVRLDALSPREREVAALVATGLSNDQIADELYLSVATVKDHVHSMLRRTGFSSRGQLIAAWYGGLS